LEHEFGILRLRAAGRSQSDGSHPGGRHRGLAGRVSGKSYEDDDPQGQVLAYAVAMDEGDGLVWMVEPEDLEVDR